MSTAPFLQIDIIFLTNIIICVGNPSSTPINHIEFLVEIYAANALLMWISCRDFLHLVIKMHIISHDIQSIYQSFEYLTNVGIWVLIKATTAFRGCLHDDNAPILLIENSRNSYYSLNAQLSWLSVCLIFRARDKIILSKIQPSCTCLYLMQCGTICARRSFISYR